MAYASTLHISPKGRNTIPAEVRAEAGIEGEVEAVVMVEGPGRIVIETPAAVSARVWDAAPESVGARSGEDIRAARDEDVVISRRRADSSMTELPDAPVSGVDALLADLGL